MGYEPFVSSEVAKMLKKAGFKWGCDHMYGLAVRHKGKDIDEDEEYELKARGKESEIEYVEGGERYYLYFDNTKDCNGYACPTLSVAQRWLRDVKGMFVTLDYFPDSWREGGHPFFEWKVRSAQLGPLACISGQSYDYDGALEKGIIKCLEILLGKDGSK
jgi:hypothetical protein